MARQNLLLVDGDTRSRRVLEVSLRKAGFSVTTAENLEQALLVLQHGEPDLIISDTRLQPEHDGFEFCLEVKKNPKWVAIPFVFLTSAKAIEDKVRGLELGVEDYLVKPIYIKEVTTRLRMLVQRKQRERLEKKDTARTKFTGHLADMAVVDLFQTIEISRKSGTIQFETELGEATIWFREGSVIDAEMGRLQADQAVYRLLGLNDGSFAVEFKPINRNAVIQESTQGLLMEGMRRVDEWGRLLEQLPPLDSVLGVDRAALADMPDGLLSTELTEVLRRFDGRRTILGVVDETGKDDLEALEAISSLFFQGLLTATDDNDEDTVELGDSSTALRLEAWDMPSASQVEAFIPPKSTPESGPHAIPSEVPPMPSFPAVGENLSGESSGGLVAGLPDETPTIGEGLTSLHDPRSNTRASEDSDPMMQALTDRFAALSASDSMEQPLQRDDDDNPAFSQLGRTLKAIVDAEDEDDALALTEPVNPEPPSEFVAVRMRAEQEEAARRRAEDELARREAERATESAARESAARTQDIEPPTRAPDVTALKPGPAPRTSPLDSLRPTDSARERSRSLTEPMFVAPRPAPVVVNDEEEDEASSSQSGQTANDPSAAKTVSELIPVFADEEKLAVGGEDMSASPSARVHSPSDAPIVATPPAARSTPPKPEPRRLAAPAPRTEPSWSRPPTLQELGLDFGKKPLVRTTPVEPPPAVAASKPVDVKPVQIDPQEIEPVAIELVEAESAEAKPAEDKPVEAANQAPLGKAKDSSTSNTTAGVIGSREDDDFAPVTVKFAEPAREPVRATSSPEPRFRPEEESYDDDEEEEDEDDDAPVPAASRPVSAAIVRDDKDQGEPGGSKIGLWIGLGVVGVAIVGLIAFKDTIFPSGSEGPKDPKTTGGKSDGSEPRDPEPDDSGKIPEPDADTTTTTTTTTAALAETDTGEAGDGTAAADTETGAPALDIETELASARRYFTKFRRTKDAKAIIDKILEVDPDHAPTLILHAQVLVEEGKIDDALAAARRAKLANPDDPEVYWILGALLEAKEDLAGAIEAYNRYVQLAPAGQYVSVAKSTVKKLERKLK